MEVSLKTVSIVVPVYFQEKGLNELHKRLTQVLSKLEKYNYEIILVNDGSTDGSFDIMKKIHKSDPKVKVVNFSRNFTQQAAIVAGLQLASGQAIVIIDDDLQDPPEVIPQMLEKWEEGYQVVYGVRTKRPGESFFKLLTAKLFYRVISNLSDVKLPVDSGDFRLIDSRVKDELVKMKEKSRYMRGLTAWVGFKQYGLTYERDARFAGKTNYNFFKLMRFAINGITSFSEKPLLLSGYIGLVATFLAFLFMLAMVVVKIISPQNTITGWTSTITVIVFFGGLQLISLGIIGVYIGKIYLQVKDRPLYIIDEKYGFSSEKEE